MSKTILAQVDGFTPVIDSIANELGVISAVVFGRMWRFCQMSAGVCKASLETIAGKTGLSRASIMRHAKKLCEAGYLKDKTPDLRNVPHIYADTGKAGLQINLQTVSQGNVTFQSETQTVSERNATVSESHLKKELKKDTKENDEVLAQISKAYESEIGVLTPMIADELREAATAYPLKWTLDAIREAATNNKRGWKYVLAILARWKAQGNQEVMKPVGQAQSNASKRSMSAYRQIQKILAEQKERSIQNVNV